MLSGWLERVVRQAVRTELDLRDGEQRALVAELWDVYQKLRMAEKRLWAIGKENGHALRLEVETRPDLDSLLRERKGLK